MFNRKKKPAIRSLLAHGSRVDGNLIFSDGFRIDGSVNGNITGSAEQPSILVISEHAVVSGEVQADHIIINGCVNGPVRARVLLELQPKARVQGDVHYQALEMHQGAVITGQLQPDPQQQEKPVLKLASNNA